MIVTVYVAGPYTGDGEPGCKGNNTRSAIQAAEELFNLGFFPFVPHLNHYWDSIYSHSYEHWIQWCFVWLERCDAVLRLPGESKGADDEVALAELAGIPVFYSVEELLKSKENKNGIA